MDELFTRTTGELMRFGREKRRALRRPYRILGALLLGLALLLAGLLYYLFPSIWP